MPTVMKTIAILLLYCCIPFSALAQEDAESYPLQYGVIPSVSLNLHNAEFRGLDGALPSNGISGNSLQSGSGPGFGIAAFISKALSPRWHVEARAGFRQWNGTLEEIDRTTVIDQSGGSHIEGRLSHRVEAGLGLLGMEFGARFQLSRRVSLRTGFGLHYLLDHYVREVDTLLEPANARFPDDSRSILLYEGAIPHASTIQAGVYTGISYALEPLAEGKIRLAPELGFNLPLTQLWSGGGWAVGGVQVGLALTLSPSPDAPKNLLPPAEPVPVMPLVIDSVRIRDTTTRFVNGINKRRVEFDTLIVSERRRVRGDTIYIRRRLEERYILQFPAVEPILSAATNVGFVLEDGSEVQRAKVTQEEFVQNRHVPPLNYIFFAENSAVMSERYKRLHSGESAAFTLSGMYRDPTLEIYRDILNIIGMRMRAYPEARISIVGCNAGAGVEKGRRELSRARARTVEQYLRDIWGIAPQRLSIEARNAPDKPSRTDDPDGIAENRRVEILSNVPELFDPLLLSDTVRTINPPRIRFSPLATAEAGLASWRLEVRQEGALLKEFGGNRSLPEHIDWDIADDIVRPLASAPIDYTLTVTDSSGQRFETPAQSIQFEQITLTRKKRERLGDKLIDRFSLILFDFDSSVLNERNRRLVQMIRNKVELTSRVEIIGTTDRMGEEEYNRRLSLERAQKISGELGTRLPGVNGVGEDEKTYDNNLPEGRFYSRTVRVNVETPIR